MEELKGTHLGRQTDYVDQYDATLLTPVARAAGRAEIGIDIDQLPFSGADLWTAYEVSWLDQTGKPQVAIGEFLVPCDSPAIIESKSFKLYLNSLNQTRFARRSAVVQTLERDLSACAGGAVAVRLFAVDVYGKQGVQAFPGESLDGLQAEVDQYQPDASLLDLEPGRRVVEEALYSHLLKTNCPVTGQPDWASVLIRYRGRRINRLGLLKYLVSYRQQRGFHEQCVERIFCEILGRCEPDMLEVYARYTRRGGLDINPFRSTADALPGTMRLARQ